MSENTTETTPVETTEQTTEDKVASPNREAANYRRQLREVQAERDALTAALTAARHTVIADRLKGKGLKLEALTAAGHELSSFFCEDGGLGDELLEKAVTDTREALGIPTRPVGIVPTQGTGDPNPNVGSWSGAFSPK